LEYLVEASGQRGLEILLARWPEVGFEAALRRTYGVTSGQLERDWQKYVKARYGWLLVLSHSLALWSILSIALFGMVWIRRRHNREALARLRASEGPDQPAYWAHDSDGETPDATGRLGSTSWTGRVPPARLPWHIVLRRPPWLNPTPPGRRERPGGQEEGSPPPRPGYDAKDSPDEPEK
jgi:hypothetical protein